MGSGSRTLWAAPGLWPAEGGTGLWDTEAGVPLLHMVVEVQSPTRPHTRNTANRQVNGNLMAAERKSVKVRKFHNRKTALMKQSHQIKQH